ncbi:RusA family crossover junction endodeoxyribonuclease [Idiomarina xiamenensis]|uniref:Crossover junction endodeoxyribonuclease rusA n=1 Tax=Idiomarina xiamenensis 10-D-4 TaxID=740709 RepID=K2K8X4_9GAMM|nr:RusA family crossover junction endodeoxyribonuclease [Idiomarina xiamenensis]EKE79459.1 bacteriophage V crossover junction endodeoxyribonuclease [Idiomarina xiamenensis 10-D-4]
MITIELPFPPSTNTYYRNVRVGNRQMTKISQRGRKFRDECYWLLKQQRVCHKLSHSLRVTITLHPPTNQRRDLDNFNKALLDVMTHAGVYEDDSQIDHLTVIRSAVAKPGRVQVIIEPMGET